MPKFTVKLTHRVEAADEVEAVQAFIDRVDDEELETFLYVVVNDETDEEFFCSINAAIPMEEALEIQAEMHDDEDDEDDEDEDEVVAVTRPGKCGRCKERTDVDNDGLCAECIIDITGAKA